jgi:hypothetical protein
MWRMGKLSVLSENVFGITEIKLMKNLVRGKSGKAFIHSDQLTSEKSRCGNTKHNTKRTQWPLENAFYPR